MHSELIQTARRLHAGGMPTDDSASCLYSWNMMSLSLTVGTGSKGRGHDRTRKGEALQDARMVSLQAGSV